MSRIIALILMAMSELVNAESYLCISEAGVGIEQSGPRRLIPAIYNVSDYKYIHTNASGKWLLKELGNESKLFDKCDQYSCTNTTGHSSFFYRERSGLFTAVFMLVRYDQPTILTITRILINGRCSEI